MNDAWRRSQNPHHPGWERGLGRWTWALALSAAAGLTGLITVGAAESAVIRLRTETITTPAPTRTAALQHRSEAPVSGLYLVQFEGAPQAAWRQDLTARGARLLRYVPDNAFIAELESAALNEIRALPFVRWVGPYEARYKVHPTLARRLATAPVGTPADIKLLVSPSANPIQVTWLIKPFQWVTYRRMTSLGTIIAGRIRPGDLPALARSPWVLWIEPGSKMRLFDEVATKIVAGDDGSAGTPATVHSLGFDGRGVIVSIADSGLDSGDIEFMHPDLAGRVEALFAYGGLPDASDEHSHGTHCAGIVAGNAATGEVDDSGYLYGLGVAPGARVVAQRIFDGVGDYYPPPTFERLTRDAVRSGAVIGSNSWGDDTQGQYDLSAAEFDALVRDADGATPGEQGYLLEFSAGNSGPGRQTIGSPAVAKNVIATGATQNNRFEFPIYGDGQEVTADFSSRGPCEDGRIKPDVMAPGTWIASLKSSYAGDENAWSPISEYYLYQGGTSQAGPHVSGAAAVFVQYYRETHGGLTPSPALVKAALINAAVDMGIGFRPDDEGEVEQVGDTGPVPNFDEGWGRVDLTELIGSDRRVDYREQGAGLSTGQVFEKRLVASPNLPLKITLVYTDAPGLPAAIPALVNDLDLEVTGPDGHLYRGNAFLEGESVPDTPAGDRINNVEAVHFADPLPGEYLIRVRAVRVVEDVHHRDGGAPEQDYALVCSGDLPVPGEGVVYFDRGVYRAPATAVVRLIDQQLAGQPSAAVTVTSTTEPAGESLTLLPGGTPGLFTSLLSLVTGPAVPGDGRITVAHGDALTLRYADADPPGERTAEASIDLQPPQVTRVIALNRFGRTTISWLTDEAANSTVVYGTPGQVSQVVSKPGFTQNHAVQLPPLLVGQNYQFYVISDDRAGNSTTNDNHGQLYGFVGTQAATALLLYSPESTWNQLYGSFFGEFPGIESWTTPLDQLGLPYEIWDLEERGGQAPTALDLAPFRVVLWRPEELGEVPSGLTDALTSYLGQGGSLLVCSFDLLSRLSLPSDATFKTNVLHVAGFEEDAGASTVIGEPGDPVGANLVVPLDYAQFPDASLFGIFWEDGNDHLRATPDATPIFRQEDGKVVGLRYPKTGSDSTNRVVFCSFPLEAVPEDTPAPDNRLTLLANALEFLVPGLRGQARLVLDRPAYTIPSAVTLEVTDVQRAGLRQVEVEVSSDTHRPPVTLSLAETVRSGVFRGRLTLVPTNQVSGPAELSVAPGASIRARYLDAVNRETFAVAEVDTTKPDISLVTVEPAYNEAVVAWQTSKPTDALVQFNLSQFPFPVNRTAYSPDITRSHLVQLDGLLPDQEYYFQVTSRDQAGNTTVDNNQGRSYRFRTLKPISPPWADDLEQGRAGWVVYNDELAVDDETGENLLNSGWQYGVPENSEGITAKSGTHCWATNLKGEPVSLAISDLISPALDLTKGNRAIFRFWQYYDFTERSEFLDIEAGQVAITTNNGATWTVIYTVMDEFSIGWERVEVDLSKYAGYVVRLRWNYQMFSFDEYPRPGWLIDDLTLTLDQTPVGTLTVTNNLEQARFTIAGPITQTASGAWLQITNAPAGEYTVTWHPADFYVTPVPQTRELSLADRVSFTGAYTFPDANANGISDLFEQRFFGTVAPAHPPDADTDADGSSDFAEFIAGTDPTSPESRLRVTRVQTLSNRTVRVEWTSVPGHVYQLELSTNVTDWLSTSEWVRATADLTAVSLPPLTDSPAYYFRVRTRP